MNTGKAVDFGAAFNFGIERLKGNPGMTLGFGAAIMVIAIALGLIVGLIVQVMAFVLAKIDPSLVLLIIPVQLLLNLIITGVFCGALIPGFFTCVARDSEGEKTSFGDLYKDQSKFLNMFITVILAQIAIFIGILFCILPGIVISPIMMISMYLVWKGDNGVDAFKKSFSILFSNLLGGLYILIMSIISSLGLILCIVGIIASLPIGYAAIWHICEQLCNEPAAPKDSGQAA